MGQSAAAGFDCQSACQSPCAAVMPHDRAFHVNVLVHAATLDQVKGPGMLNVASQWPAISISVPEGGTKESGLAKWSKEKGQWEFRESLTVRVGAQEEISIVVTSSTSYNLMMGSTALEPRQVAERRFLVAEILPRMRVEDRKGEGHVYATPMIPFDLFAMGSQVGASSAAAQAPVGRVFLSFETRTGWAVHGKGDGSMPTLLSADTLVDDNTSWKGSAGIGASVIA